MLYIFRLIGIDPDLTQLHLIEKENVISVVRNKLEDHFILRCVKARVQNLMKNGIQNLICMHFNLLFCKNHHEILKVNVNHHC